MRVLLPWRFPVRRRVFDFGVEFRAREDGDTGYVEPEKDDDDPAYRAVASLRSP